MLLNLVNIVDEAGGNQITEMRLSDYGPTLLNCLALMMHITRLFLTLV